MAATAIQAAPRWALRAHHSTSLAVSLAVCARACRSADGGVDPLPATMQMINFEIALRSRDGFHFLLEGCGVFSCCFFTG